MRQAVLSLAASALLLSTISVAQAVQKTAAKAEVLPKVIPVVVVSYFPIDGLNIDKHVTGDWGAPYLDTKAKCEKLTTDLVAALGNGSRFRGYKDAATKPSLKYEVVARFEFKKGLPVCDLKPGEKVPMTDYNAIMREIGIKNWVENKGVKEVWIWGYHGGVLNLWESNMSSPYGDTSNSSRDDKDLPVLKSTYTVYHYNYQRGLGEAIEDHMHQLEALLNHIDGRDTAPAEKWPELLFWGKFVGSDVSHKIATNPARCGWTH
jgi:hypothetical protein